MAVDVSQFDDVAQLDIHFKKALRNASEAEDEAKVQREWDQAKASFWEYRAQKAANDVALRDALDEFPYAKKFKDLIRGNTPEEIKASAKSVHERADAEFKLSDKAEQERLAREEQERTLARGQYGAPPQAGGSNPPTQNNLTPGQAATERTRRRLLEGKGAQDGGGRMDVALMERYRIRDALDYIAETGGGSYRNPPDRKVQDDRGARRLTPPTRG